MSLPWVEKYRPKKRSDLIGNFVEINTVFSFLRNWRIGKSKPGLLLLGPPGCGKTSAVFVVGNELNFEIIEINASDVRNKKSVKSVLGKASKSINVFAPKPRILLMDEVDGLAGNSDRGGLNELIKIFKTSQHPIICTANDPESDKIKKLKSELRVINFNRLDEFDIFELLEKISILEKIEIEEEEIEFIVENSQGDLRAAINDLESLIHKNSNINSRDKMESLTEMMNDLFKSKNIEDAKKALSNSPSNYRFLLHHIFDLTDYQCKTPLEIVNSYDQIAYADLILSRIMIKQDWSQLRYFFDILSSGLYISKNPMNYKKIEFLPLYPNSAKLIGLYNRKKNLYKPIIDQVSPKLHISRKKFLQEDLPLFIKIINGFNGHEIAAKMDLSDKVVSLIEKLGNNRSLIKNVEISRKKVQSKRLHQSFTNSKYNFTIDPYLLKHDQKNKSDEDNIINTSEDNILSENNKVQTSLDDFF